LAIRWILYGSEGAGVATTRGDIDIVVTEYGIAELRRKSIYQRVIELAQIAHPKFRQSLIEEAKKRRYIFGDQLPPTTEDLMFLDVYKRTVTFSSGQSIEFRPLFPSDEFETRHFFYSLQEKTVYDRYFYKRRVFSREMLQKQWASVDYRRNMSIIGFRQVGRSKQIVAIGSYSEYDKNRAEVAFLVKEELHGLGIGSYLLQVLETIARENGYTGFVATALAENKKMIGMFRKHYPDLTTKSSGGGEIDIDMVFK